MKSLMRKSVIAATLTLALAVSSFQSIAQGGTLVYDKSLNSSIGISVPNAVGASYTIKDQRGAVVLEGTVKSDKTFYISTAKLNAGSYRFCIGSLALQQFDIK